MDDSKPPLNSDGQTATSEPQPDDHDDNMSLASCFTHLLELLKSADRQKDDLVVAAELTRFQNDLHIVINRRETQWADIRNSDAGFIDAEKNVNINDLPPEVRACIKTDNVLLNDDNGLSSCSDDDSDDDDDDKNNDNVISTGGGHRSRIQSLLYVKGYGIHDEHKDKSSQTIRRKRIVPDNDVIDHTGREVRDLFEEDWKTLLENDDMTLLYHPRAIHEKHAHKYKRLKETNRLHLLTKRDRKPASKSSSSQPLLPVTSRPPFTILLPSSRAP